MYPNPFTDAWHFVTGDTGNYNPLGNWKYILVALFWSLLAGSVVLAIKNWRADPAQRTGLHVGTWVARVLIGTMWFEAMLWKLPFSRENGLHFWMEQMAQRAAFSWHRDLVSNYFLPYFSFLNPVIFLTEFVFAVCLILGFGVRLVSVVAVLFCLHLWLGIYRTGNPAEWAWSYIFLALLHALFAIYAAGRSLGLDAILRGPSPLPHRSARLHRAVS